MTRSGQPPFDSLQGWLEWQGRLHSTQIELGLERVAEVWRRMGAPSPGRRILTVGGTNGKGSCVAFLEAILGAAGYATVAYSSPHLYRYNERIRVGGRPVGDARICAAFERVEAARAQTSLTYFEYGTLAALEVFAQAGPDVAILEVGLGGRLDAVNIVDPDVALITNLSLEHTAWLGPDRETIGREKAGILRAGGRAVIGEPAPPASVLRRVRELDVDAALAGRDFRYRVRDGGWDWHGRLARRRGLPMPALRGAFQLDNAAAALMALEMLGPDCPVAQAAVRDGLQAVRLRGRFEVVPGRIPVILDVAHNPAAARALAANLQAMPCPGRTLAVFGVLADKDLAGMVAPLAPMVHTWYTAPPAAERALPRDRLEAGLRAAGAARLHGLEALGAALKSAQRDARPGDRILVFGSFITAAEVGALL
ncbi:MAG: bifunctional tetrahydrofolate synthase/dihydrofolate synthase [Chromatiales bacterium]|jgi:dihydrofolate synthase/folylpolyglutamate synthase